MSFSTMLTGRNIALNTSVQLYKWHNWKNYRCKLARPEVKHGCLGNSENRSGQPGSSGTQKQKLNNPQTFTSVFLLKLPTVSKSTRIKLLVLCPQGSRWPSCWMPFHLGLGFPSQLTHFTNSKLIHVVSALLKWNFLVKHIKINLEI